MERPRWDRIQEIYHSSLRRAPSERSAFVASACAADPDLMREVKSLLDADEATGDFLESSIFEVGLKIITSSDASGAPTGDDAKDELIGETIGGYLIEKKLGEGGMSKVYFARELDLHSRPVVIKILLEALLLNPYLRKKFKQEVEALARLNYPNVVTVLSNGEFREGKPYIVMQYVSGQTLRSQIRDEGMNLKRTAAILKQIGGALDYIHEQDIIHRDLKPENIMLQELKDGTEFVVIVDFGIAKVKDSAVGQTTADNVAIGTARYMSPEQLRGEVTLTAESDVYSVAVMAFEMVTGRRPFNPETPAQMLELQRKGVQAMPVHLRPSLSTKAQAIILKGLSFKRTARYQKAAEFCDDLACALTDGLGHPNEQEDDRSWWRKKSAMVAGLVMVLCLAALIAVYIGYGRDGRNNSVLSPTPTPTPNTLPTRSLVYWLEVRPRNGRAYQNFFQSTNLDVFETGDKFRLNVSCPEPGYVYLFNEGTPEPRGTSFTVIYPTPEMNDGSASIGKNQPLQTNWNTFRGRPGTENFWIVWSISPIGELESAKREAFKHREGGLTGETLDAVKKFLTTKAAEVNVRTSRDKQTQRTTLRGQGDVLVKLVEFEHR